MVLFGPDCFWAVPLPGANLDCRTESIFRTHIEKMNFHLLGAADFNSDGVPDLVAVDGKSNVLELLIQGKESWTSAMHFQIFEKNIFHEGKAGMPLEPREMCLEDFNHDGKKDLVLLCHDRLLFYPQQ